MAAIKFSKQYIEPNPNEIDYWVDLSSNQYGGRMKYHNGFEWVDLVNPDGTHIDINDFYNKLQINQMLSQKASVDSVESKVDDDEVSDVIKNISFSQRGEDGVEMVMFKYDDTTVGIQLPIADNTKSGIITKDTFKNLVNQTQLQQLYSEMYTKLSEIRNNYQPKLRAGANIKIENNVISAVSKIGTDWNDIANKPDIYDKSQVDTMMSGVYKIKDSRRFEALPLYGNTVGDTYNITNDFSLHGEDYPLGTNVVWTENGWDALAGIFDTSELEEDIQEVKDNYLPLSGGSLKGQLEIDADSTNVLTVKTNTTNQPTIIFKGKAGTLSRLTTNGTNNSFFRTDAGWTTNYRIWDEGNDGEGSGLDADTLDGKHLHEFFDIVKNPKTQIDLYHLSVDKAAAISWDSATSNNVLNKPDFVGASLFHFPGEKGWQFCKPYNKQELLFRDRYENNWFDWKTIAFTDSNVASATKLATPVKLWGNDFDGSEDLNGRIVVTSPQSTDFAPLISAYNPSLTTGKHTAINFGYDSAPNNYAWLGFYYEGSHSKNNAIRLGIGGGNSDVVTVNGHGNVGIGTTDPQHKLEVAGTIALSDQNGATFVYPQGIDSGGHVKANGHVYIPNNNSVVTFDTNNVPHRIMLMTSANEFVIGHDIADSEYPTFIDGKNITFRYNKHNVGIMLNSSGNVTIGGSNLASNDYKLYVDGSLNLTGSIYLSGTPYIRHVKDVYSIFGNGTTETYVRGSSIRFQIDQNSNMIVNQYGNVTMGESDLAGANHKLYVTGTTVVDGYVYCKNIQARNGESTFAYSDYSDPAPSKNAAVKISGNVYQANGEVSFNGQITSGDLIDWYGVSWSEDSSDPTCTRIGNMALHRSLPIQSAMKGYYIGNKLSNIPDGIIPLSDDWSNLKYNNNNNTPESTQKSFSAGNIMVKIPEFWYIDDYEYLTNTHNLKISQTAKAGWIHHKEAYVGAYEGVATSSQYYLSIKNHIPTVNMTREQLRTAARTNGYENEYKWNIYTYEEHRAICHLFLVEYATRNSQAPVNTALTADGFKQGGLGSGCTTGTMDGAYSFIPTGTTDSLGNGSGQVAYTASNGTTYYANRYRGIENPFGHIWKHVDDIVNVYNAGTTYKTVYKCNKPEHFATNKNAKYKPLCSFPGGSTMQGQSKEIKATINCDFFKYSVGGSESTYWCDYNYDNDDTSEHCLLIGGRSGYGGGAGLFCFLLDHSVGNSSGNFGSRLTYLPWAE